MGQQHNMVHQVVNCWDNILIPNLKGCILRCSDVSLPLCTARSRRATFCSPLPSPSGRQKVRNRDNHPQQPAAAVLRGSLEHACTENHPYFKYCLLRVEYAFFKKTEHTQMTTPCMPWLLLIKRTHKNFGFLFPGYKDRRVAVATWCLSLQIQGRDVGGQSTERLLWESPSLSGYFLALFSLLASNLFAVSTPKRPQSSCLPGTEVLGLFLVGNAVLRGCSLFCAEPELTGRGGGDGVVLQSICCRVTFAAGQEVIWDF